MSIPVDAKKGFWLIIGAGAAIWLFTMIQNRSGL